MLFWLFLTVEILLLLAICLPLALFAPLPAALIIIVVCLTAVIFVRPAHRLALSFRNRRRRVVRRFHPRPVPTGLTLRPAGNLTPAEAFRLLELTGFVPENRRAAADFTATLLDLNRRGILALRMSDGDDMLRADGIRILIRHDFDVHTLTAHEQAFLRFLRRAGGSGNGYSVQMSAFCEEINRSPYRAYKELDTIRALVDQSLIRRKCIGYLREKPKHTKNGKHPLFSRRIRVLTPRGEQLAAFWRAYLQNITTRPFLDSYQARSGEDQESFARDAAQLLVDAACGGCCARAAEALMREYLFEPSALWQETNYFSNLTETRCAFAGTENGESYFFMPLKSFEMAIQTAMLAASGGSSGSGSDISGAL